MSIKDKMKNAKESHLFDGLSESEKFEAILNGRLKVRLIDELERMNAEIGKCRDYIIVNHNNTDADMNRLDGINLVAAIIDKRIAELKGENTP